MKTKTLSMFGLSFLVMILLVSVASADMVFNPTSFSTTITQGTTSVNVDFDLNHTGVGGNYTNLIWTGEATQGTWTLPSLTALNVNESQTLSATLGAIPTSFSGTITGSITVNNSGTPYEVLPITITVTEDTTSEDTDFCGVNFGELDSNVSNPGDLDVKIDYIDNFGIGGDDEWYPNDELEVRVEIKNDGSEDVDNVVVEWGLWSTETDEWAIEIDEEDDFDVKDDDEETITFTIDLYDDLDVDLDELKDGEYVLYVRAYGEIDDGSDTETCDYDSEEITIFVEEDLVVLNDIKLTGTSFCGNMIQVTADILNIGEEDQEEISLTIYNSELGINEDIAIGDIDAFEDKKLDFEFMIPKDAEEKIYTIKLTLYDEDNDVYENGDEDESQYSLSLDVSGSCQVAPDAVVYASLESGGKAGEEIKIKASVTNKGDESETFTISVADYSSWAELISISPEETTINAGASKDVILTFKVNKDAEENQNFNIVLSNEGGESTSQPIAVTIEQASGLLSMIKNNGYLWAIAIINVILIVVIILVAVKVTRK